MMNRLANVNNRYQGATKKVLCVCSAGLLRSPTAAVVLSQPPFNFNTRAAGITKEFALIPVDDILIAWADEIVVMDTIQAQFIRDNIGLDAEAKPIICLDIPDIYEYRAPELMKLITDNYNQWMKK